MKKIPNITITVHNASLQRGRREKFRVGVDELN